MKKILGSFVLFMLAVSGVSANVEDNQIEDALKNDERKELELDFRLKSFKSCEDMEDVMGGYFQEYFKNNTGFGRGFHGLPEVMEMSIDASMDDSAGVATSVQSKAVTSSSSGGADGDYSKTNTQVKGVDESDIVKTDGQRTYYYNATKKAVYIIEGTEVLKKINIPKSFHNAELYIADDILTIISTGYLNRNYSKSAYFFNRNSKTYTMVFDVESASKPRLEKLHISDGNYSKSRKIGDYVYVLTNNYLNVPYSYYNKGIDDLEVDAGKIIPRQIELTLTDDSKKQNLTIKGKKLPYNVSGGRIASCDEIEYVLPDEETIKKYSFNPSYNIISVINVADSSDAVQTKIIAGSNNEVYMSLDNLYLSSRLHTSYDFVCPFWGHCFMPFYYRGDNTLIHKLNVNDNLLTYDTSTIVPGNPLTQYSMDEKDGNFRIITQNYYPERSSSLYILDEELQMLGSLTGMGKTEDFKSSRYIGDKLFLVTFQQIDPLFAIDLSDPSDPTILGELKIPGYSTYLHPYDETHLIGLGQATEESNGRVRNGGLKVDLYQINYDKKCGDAGLDADEQAKCDSGDYKGIIVKQKHSMELGQRGSYSEALHNPRMFIWNESREKLLLPVQLYKNENPTNEYLRTDFYQGVSVIDINKDSGIKESGRITHMDFSNAEAERAKECERYSSVPEEPECRELIGGGEYCGSSRREYNYVPTYCYADADIGEYIAQKSWNYSKSFVKRALYIGDSILTLSDEKLQENSFDTLEYTSSVQMK